MVENYSRCGLGLSGFDVYILSATFYTSHLCKDEQTGLTMWFRFGVQMGSG